MCNDEILDGIKPFNGVCVIIKGLCVLNVTPMPIDDSGEYQVTLGIPNLSSHTAKIEYCQYSLKDQQWTKPANTIPLSALTSIKEDDATHVKIKNSSEPYPTPYSRFLSFSYAPNLSTLYQMRHLFKEDEDIIVNWDKLPYQINFSSDNGAFSTFKLSATASIKNKQLISAIFSREDINKTLNFGYIADSICYKLEFNTAKRLVFRDNNSHEWAVCEEDNKFTLVEISNEANDDKDCGIYNCYYEEQIIMNNNNKDIASISMPTEIPMNKRILPLNEIPDTNCSDRGFSDGVAYCSPLITSYPKN